MVSQAAPSVVSNLTSDSFLIFVNMPGKKKKIISLNLDNEFVYLHGMEIGKKICNVIIIATKEIMYFITFIFRKASA